MIDLQISLVSEPARLPCDYPVAGPEQYNRFVAAVERHLGSAVERRYGFLRDVAPSTGFILLDGSAHPEIVLEECSAKGLGELASRLVPLGRSQTRIFENVLEKLEVPAAVDGLSFVEWEAADPDAIGAWGPYGRSDIAPLIGAKCVLYESPRYCYLQSASHYGLPHLLVDYLRALVSASSIS
jgi:hypothetical protein